MDFSILSSHKWSVSPPPHLSCSAMIPSGPPDYLSFNFITALTTSSRKNGTSRMYSSFDRDAMARSSIFLSRFWRSTSDRRRDLDKVEKWSVHALSRSHLSEISSPSTRSLEHLHFFLWGGLKHLASFRRKRDSLFLIRFLSLTAAHSLIHFLTSFRRSFFLSAVNILVAVVKQRCHKSTHLRLEGTEGFWWLDVRPINPGVGCVGCFLRFVGELQRDRLWQVIRGVQIMILQGTHSRPSTMQPQHLVGCSQ